MRTPPARDGSVGEVFREALRLGLTSFGGPVAHLGAFRERYVRRLGWLDDATFADLVAFGQALPGPTSSKVGLAIGWLRAGPAGALAAFTAFTLPSAVLMTLIALGLGRASLADPRVAGLVAGLQLAAVAIVAQAVVGMARSLTPDAPRIVVAGIAALLALVLAPGLAPLVVVAFGALTGLALRDRLPPPAADSAGRADHAGRAEGRLRIGRGVAVAALVLFGVVVLVPALAVALGDEGLGALAWAHVRAGTLVFGGAHVVLPLLEASVVEPGWLDRATFLAGYGAVQAMPGPLFTIAAYVGAAAPVAPDPLVGAAVALAAIFLPGILLMIGLLPAWAALRADGRARAALVGVNAAVVGLLVAALVTPVATTAIRGPLDALVALAAFGVALSGRVPVLAVVAALALAGTLGLLGR